MQTFEEMMRKGGKRALEEASRFFMKQDSVHQALQKICQQLEQLQLPYAVVGGMALVAHGYDRTTVDVDILVTKEGLQTIHQQLVGRGYLPPFAGSKHLRDTELGVKIEFLTTGDFPGDGKPKPVSFPNPAEVFVELDGIHYLSLSTLIELKLASGMTNAGRLKDLADVQELIRNLHLESALSAKLHPYVQEKYLELWDALQEHPE